MLWQAAAHNQAQRQQHEEAQEALQHYQEVASLLTQLCQGSSQIANPSAESGWLILHFDLFSGMYVKQVQVCHNSLKQDLFARHMTDRNVACCAVEQSN